MYCKMNNNSYAFQTVLVQLAYDNHLVSIDVFYKQYYCFGFEMLTFSNPSCFFFGPKMQLEYIKKNKYYYKTFTGSCLISSNFTALAIPDNESIFMHGADPTSFRNYNTITYKYTDTDTDTQQLIYSSSDYMHILSVTVVLSNLDTVNIEPYFKIINNDSIITRDFGHVETVESTVTLRGFYPKIYFTSNCPANITITCSKASHMF